MEHDRRFILRGLAAAVMLAPVSAVAATPMLRPPAGGSADDAMRATDVQHRDGPGIRRGPPPRRQERMGRRPPGPRDRYVWRQGYWVHQGNGYVWRPGSYMERPRPRATWVPDRWVQRGGRWVFIEGHWR